MRSLTDMKSLASLRMFLVSETVKTTDAMNYLPASLQVPSSLSLISGLHICNTVDLYYVGIVSTPFHPTTLKFLITQICQEHFDTCCRVI